MRIIFGIFPLLAIPVLIYNLMGFAGPGADYATMAQSLSHPIATLPMVAPGSTWAISSGDILIILALGFFFVEILKSTSTGTASIANHAVSMIVFIVCLIEFLLLKNFSTSVFFILTIMSLLDVLAGVVVTIISARRDYSVAESGFGAGHR
jgi:hypothetical protein